MEKTPRKPSSKTILLLCVFALLISLALQAKSQKAVAARVDAARYSASGDLMFPSDYREWIFLSSGVNMSYSPNAGAAEPDRPIFDNVFVNPESYRAFLADGRWPDGTVMVLEIRRGSNKGSINQAGHYQGTDLRDIEVHVKDTQRFEGGWAFFGFTREGGGGKKFAQSASCYSCHQEHGAVDTTFVQFYPTLLKVASEKGTLSPEYTAKEKLVAGH